MLRANLIETTNLRGRLALRCVLACVFLCSSAFHTLALAERVVTVLVPFAAYTLGPTGQKNDDLTVQARGGAQNTEVTSYLEFDFSVLPPSCPGRSVHERALAICAQGRGRSGNGDHGGIQAASRGRLGFGLEPELHHEPDQF